MRPARFRLLALLPLFALTLAARADTLDQFTIIGGGESLSVLLPAYSPLALFDNQVSLTGPGVFDGVVGDYSVHIIFPGSCAVCSTIFSPLPELGLPALFDFPYISGTTFFHLLPGTYTTFEVGPNFVPPGGPYTITITPQSTTPTPECPTLLLLGTGLAWSTLLIAGRRLH